MSSFEPVIASPAPRHLRWFLWFGALTIVFAILTPLLLASHVRSERARLAACERQERLDCDPSVIWLLMK